MPHRLDHHWVTG